MTAYSNTPQPTLPPKYFAYPDSYHLPRRSQLGLYPVALLGILSLFTTAISMAHLVYRMYTTPALRRNQALLLILNLLFADFQQAMSFALGLHWAVTGTILAPTDLCTAQAWLIQIGDLASGLFSLAIAAHTWRFLVVRRGMRWRWFCVEVGAIWGFCVLLSVVGPIMFGERFFVRAGVWCWVGERFKVERLAFHYVWIFICEFGSILLYAVIFLTLHYRTQNASLTRVARYMLLYPFTYTCLTLPLAAFRMANYSGRRLDDSYYIAAGACMASCGWVDVGLYVWTRRRVFKAAVDGEVGGAGHGAKALASFYGNTTVVGRCDGPDDGDMPEMPIREGVVKLEHVVRVTVEHNEEFVSGGEGRVKTLGEGTHVVNSRGW